MTGRTGKESGTLPPLPAGLWAKAAGPPVADGEGLRGGLLLLCLAYLISGVVALIFGFRDSDVEQLALGTVGCGVSLSSALASRWWQDRYLHGLRRILADLPVILTVMLLLVVLGYGVFGLATIVVVLVRSNWYFALLLLPFVVVLIYLMKIGKVSDLRVVFLGPRSDEQSTWILGWPFWRTGR